MDSVSNLSKSLIDRIAKRPLLIIITFFLYSLLVSYIHPTLGDEWLHTELARYLIKNWEYPYYIGSTENPISVYPVRGIMYQFVFYPPLYHVTLGIFSILSLEALLSPLTALIVLFFTYKILNHHVGFDKKEISLFLFFTICFAPFFRSSSMTTMDMMVGATLSAYLYRLLVFANNPLLRNALVLGLVGAVALTIKQSAVIIFPLSLIFLSLTTFFYDRTNYVYKLLLMFLSLSISTFGILSWLIHYPITHMIFYSPPPYSSSFGFHPKLFLIAILSVFSFVDLYEEMLREWFPYSVFLGINSIFIGLIYTIGFYGFASEILRKKSLNHFILLVISTVLISSLLLVYLTLLKGLFSPYRHITPIFPFIGIFGGLGFMKVQEFVGKSYIKVGFLTTFFLFQLISWFLVSSYFRIIH